VGHILSMLAVLARAADREELCELVSVSSRLSW